ncbi:MAG: site-specific DNA-methyltransferase [Elusimicrobiota bacterium]|jgi:site-specific DNA-methyltransferase (adenine-specific)|nr:site-specific DNA-methyltransferase [Elusimicrobiota bacterium]
MLEINQIHNLDCIDFLNQIDKNCIDLAIIDPPYNMKKAAWDKFGSNIDFFNFTFAWIDALIPKLHKNGSLYIFNTPFNCAFILKHLLEKGMLFQNWLTWDKRDGMGGAKRKYSNGQETILFFTKSAQHTFNYEDIRLPYESAERIEHAAKKGILKNGKRWFPNPKGKLCGEVWHITSERHKRKVKGKVQKLSHITPKPFEMIERIVKASSNEKDLVLDCFVGCGTTAIASKKLNRNFICSDNNAQYTDIAKKELENADTRY